MKLIKHVPHYLRGKNLTYPEALRIVVQRGYLIENSNIYFAMLDHGWKRGLKRKGKKIAVIACRKKWRYRVSSLYAPCNM